MSKFMTVVAYIEENVHSETYVSNKLVMKPLLALLKLPAGCSMLCMRSCPNQARSQTFVRELRLHLMHFGSCRRGVYKLLTALCM